MSHSDTLSERLRYMMEKHLAVGSNPPPDRVKKAIMMLADDIEAIESRLDYLDSRLDTLEQRQ